MREMKDSGMPWIGKIPKDWKTDKFKYHLKRSEPRNPGNQVVLSLYRDYGIIPKDSRDDNHNVTSEDTSNYKYVQIGDFVVNKMKAWQGSVAVSNYEGIVSPAYYVYKFSDHQIYKKYLHYLLRACYKDEFMRLSGGLRVGQWDLSADGLGNTYILIPPYDEQVKIADYLDSKKERIDSIRKNVEAEIEALKQYKQSVITEAVTKGLDKNVEMKDSGIPWIGEIPKNWEIIKGKYILIYLQRPILSTDKVITCFRDGEVTLRSNRREDGFTISEKEIGYQGIDVGDLVIHGMDGFAGSIGISDSRGKASPVLNVLNSSQDKKFLMYYLRSMAYNNVFLALSTGIRVRSCDLNWNKLANLPYAIPPIDEQHRIADYLNTKCAKIDSIIQNKQELLANLDTYKKSLIYEYVTGKKEVPSA